MKEKQIEKEAVNPKDDQIAKLQAQLKEANDKLKYQPQKADMPKNQLGLPKGMRSADIKTSIIDISDKIKEKMDQLEDLATMEVMLDPIVRMKNRLESIKSVGSAKHYKIQGHWKTIRPKMYITKLEGKKVSNEQMEITFGVFDVDENGDKRLYTNFADVHMQDGNIIKRPTSAEYKIAYEVKETIMRGKPITREILTINL